MALTLNFYKSVHLFNLLVVWCHLLKPLSSKFHPLKVEGEDPEKVSYRTGQVLLMKHVLLST